MSDSFSLLDVDSVLDPADPNDRAIHFARLAAYERALDWYAEERSLVGWEAALGLRRPLLGDFGLTAEQWRDWRDYCEEAASPSSPLDAAEVFGLTDEEADAIPF